MNTKESKELQKKYYVKKGNDYKISRVTISKTQHTRSIKQRSSKQCYQLNP
jgi:hypothetical protein